MKGFQEQIEKLLSAKENRLTSLNQLIKELTTAQTKEETMDTMQTTMNLNDDEILARAAQIAEDRRKKDAAVTVEMLVTERTAMFARLSGELEALILDFNTRADAMAENLNTRIQAKGGKKLLFSKSKAGKAAGKGALRPRMSDEMRVQIGQDISKFLTKNPGSTKADLKKFLEQHQANHLFTVLNTWMKAGDIVGTPMAGYSGRGKPPLSLRMATAKGKPAARTEPVKRSKKN